MCLCVCLHNLSENLCNVYIMIFLLVREDELVERSKEYDVRKTRIDLLQEKLQEVEKALVSTDKMKRDTQTDIDSLQ